ncbi:FHA domain-containing protein [Salinibacterium sp. NG253]|uniref:FHA domain-containing protein n=1 Tax=Salinibacterium sp. NG253 TaxID=2792039 RepID=UPI001E5638DA|nr:FHA domain-containing protein [Salinibacterium sp. NG253]
MKYLYAPSTDSLWSAVVADELIVFVDSSEENLLATLWANRALGAQHAVEALSAQGLAATPAFALVEWTAEHENPAGARVIVRGAVSVSLTTRAGNEAVSGARVSTWAESYFDDVIDCTISVNESTTIELLPIVAGVVKAGRLNCTHDEEASEVHHVKVDEQVPGIRAALLGEAEASAAVAPVNDASPVSETTIADRPPGVARVADVAQPVAAASEIGRSNDVNNDGQGYDFLFGETVMRDVSAAANARNDEAETPAAGGSNPAGATDLIGTAPQFSEPVAPVVVDPPEPEGDHDGMTIMTSDLVGLRAPRPAAAFDEVRLPPVSALYLQLSTGAREMLSQPILVGRAPTVSKVSGGSLPRLVTIPGDKDISRNHVQIVVEGGTVVVTDLHSRNGTHVALPGRQAQRLRAGEPTAVIVGTVIDLGGDVTLTVGEES